MSNADEYILEECYLREERLAHEKYQKEKIANLTSENASLNSEIKSLSSENAYLRKLLEENGIKP